MASVSVRHRRTALLVLRTVTPLLSLILLFTAFAPTLPSHLYHLDNSTIEVTIQTDNAPAFVISQRALHAEFYVIPEEVYEVDKFGNILYFYFYQFLLFIVRLFFAPERL